MRQDNFLVLRKNGRGVYKPAGKPVQEVELDESRGLVALAAVLNLEPFSALVCQKCGSWKLNEMGLGKEER